MKTITISGATLHRALGVPLGETIPIPRLWEGVCGAAGPRVKCRAAGRHHAAA